MVAVMAKKDGRDVSDPLTARERAFVEQRLLTANATKAAEGLQCGFGGLTRSSVEIIPHFSPHAWTMLSTLDGTNGVARFLPRALKEPKRFQLNSARLPQAATRRLLSACDESGASSFRASALSHDRIRRRCS